MFMAFANRHIPRAEQHRHSWRRAFTQDDVARIKLEELKPDPPSLFDDSWQNEPQP